MTGQLVRLCHPVGGLAALVDAVAAGDALQGWRSAGYAASRRAGFHARVAGARAGGASDQGVWEAGRDWLDRAFPV